MTVEFGLRDYWRMLVRRGPKLPFRYFVDAHMFDLVRGTDTHFWQPKQLVTDPPDSFNDGILYMPCWTSEIRRLYRALEKISDIAKFTCHLDLGSGKGKFVMLWRAELLKRGLEAPVIGVEYVEELSIIARGNYLRVFGVEGEFILEDVGVFDFSVYQDPLLIYMYNPFNEEVFRKVLRSLLGRQVVVLYSNPVLSGCLADFGYRCVWFWHSWHPTARSAIYFSPNF